MLALLRIQFEIYKLHRINNSEKAFTSWPSKDTGFVLPAY